MELAELEKVELTSWVGWICSNKSRTLSFENRKNVARVALSPDGKTIISVDEGKQHTT